MSSWPGACRLLWLLLVAALLLRGSNAVELHPRDDTTTRGGVGGAEHTALHPIHDAIVRHQNPANCSAHPHFRLKEGQQGLTGDLAVVPFTLAMGYYQGAIIHFGPNNSHYQNPLSCPSRSFECYFQPLTHCPMPPDTPICYMHPMGWLDGHWRLAQNITGGQISDLGWAFAAIAKYAFRPNQRLQARITFHKNLLQLPDCYLSAHMRTQRLTTSYGKPRPQASVQNMVDAVAKRMDKRTCSDTVFITADTLSLHEEFNRSLHALRPNSTVRWVDPRYVALSFDTHTDIMDGMGKRWYATPRDFDEGMEFLSIVFLVVGGRDFVSMAAGGVLKFIADLKWVVRDEPNITVLVPCHENTCWQTSKTLCSPGMIPTWPTGPPWRMLPCRPGSPPGVMGAKCPKHFPNPW